MNAVSGWIRWNIGKKREEWRRSRRSRRFFASESVTASPRSHHLRRRRVGQAQEGREPRRGGGTNVRAHGSKAEKPEFRCGSAARSIVLARWRRYAEVGARASTRRRERRARRRSEAERPEFRCRSADRSIVLARWRRCAEARRVGAEGASQGQLPTGAKRKDQNFDVEAQLNPVY